MNTHELPLDFLQNSMVVKNYLPTKFQLVTTLSPITPLLSYTLPCISLSFQKTKKNAKACELMLASGKVHGGAFGIGANERELEFPLTGI